MIGNTDITLESLAAGGVIGMRVVVVLIAFAVYSACVNPDAVLRAMRPIARRSALTAALVSRLVPLAVADLARAREAAALRGPAAAPVGRTVLARRLVEGSLDRSVDVAATLELRGHSLEGGGARRREPAGPRARLLFSCRRGDGRGDRRAGARRRVGSMTIPGSPSTSSAATLALSAAASRCSPCCPSPGLA